MRISKHAWRRGLRTSPEELLGRRFHSCRQLKQPISWMFLCTPCARLLYDSQLPDRQQVLLGVILAPGSAGGLLDVIASSGGQESPLVTGPDTQRRSRDCQLLVLGRKGGQKAYRRALKRCIHTSFCGRLEGRSASWATKNICKERNTRVYGA